MRHILILALVLAGCSVFAQKPIWQFAKDGGISWKPAKAQVHSDHIEMSGRQLSAILRYGVNEKGALVLEKKLVFPMLRTIPNDTRGSLIRRFTGNLTDQLLVDGQPWQDQVDSLYINGYLSVTSHSGGMVLNRKIYPSADKAACLEWCRISNRTTRDADVYIPEINRDSITPAEKGVYGAYVLNQKMYNGGNFTLAPGETRDCWLVISGRKATESPYYYAAAFEFSKRSAFLEGIKDDLVLTTPNDTINRMFAFAKIRAAESIFDTKAGLLHAPGGGEYYAAIWANDQAEYVNPFFGYLGYDAGIASAINSFRLFASWMNPAFEPIPSSIIAEGDSYWNGAGDRGDQAMIGYGAAFFAVTRADTVLAQQLWPLVNWCNEYLLRKKTTDGVIASTSDELEGRFPTGEVNLSTNILTYASLQYGARLAQALGKEATALNWKATAATLKTSIEKYFGATVEGFQTYRYYDGNDKLRSWIALPLVMNFDQRRDQTIKALLSDRLWTRNGMLTESGSKTFWDRSTLYAFRGLLKAGATDTCLRYLAYYSSRRLLGEHVPYAIEAWPEGDQRHLSAESGLYARVLTEGLFGLDPVGFREFRLSPHLPVGWNEMSLKRISICNTIVDVMVKRMKTATSVTVKVAGKPARTYQWDGRKPLSILIQ
ncbi:hypothetical protein [Flavihumibacter petaseus]|uniref:Alpha-L-rhamnosidase six-hairpin glycosidase domain-containing protein n=1 Tax=Flavihumibacter petaseus NBRC 106054 TaxID=1220578 RepID=A0A0E9MWR1_9BACT|nr:hypothetical protein [Flavihumibacter petaseus]GAO41933.1 hypothetical protein FPE01S_01_09480 [Flavihumibacter petaseus NBRC 106054]